MCQNRLTAILNQKSLSPSWGSNTAFPDKNAIALPLVLPPLQSFLALLTSTTTAPSFTFSEANLNGDLSPGILIQFFFIGFQSEVQNISSFLSDRRRWRQKRFNWTFDTLTRKWNEKTFLVETILISVDFIQTLDERSPRIYKIPSVKWSRKLLCLTLPPW